MACRTDRRERPDPRGGSQIRRRTRPQSTVIIALDSGALIATQKGFGIDAFIATWLEKGATFVIPAPAIAEVTRGGAKDASINRLINAVANVAEVDEAVAREAGRRLVNRPSHMTLDALIVATAEAAGATHIVTTDPLDVLALTSGSMHVIPL